MPWSRATDYMAGRHTGRKGEATARMLPAAPWGVYPIESTDIEDAVAGLWQAVMTGLLIHDPIGYCHRAIALSARRRSAYKRRNDIVTRAIELGIEGATISAAANMIAEHGRKEAEAYSAAMERSEIERKAIRQRIAKRDISRADLRALIGKIRQTIGTDALRRWIGPVLRAYVRGQALSSGQRRALARFRRLFVEGERGTVV